MENSNKNIEQVFKDGFDNLELEVSNKVWNNLDAKLFGNQIAYKKESWAKIISIGTLPVMLLIVATFLTPAEPTKLPNFTSSSLVEQEEKNEVTAQEIGNVEEVIVYDYQEVEGMLEIVSEEGNNSDDTEISNGDIIEEGTQSELPEQKEVIEPIEKIKRKSPTLSNVPYLNNDYYKQRSAKEYSSYSINKLKKGVLLVRLKTMQKSIDALQKRGMKAKAEKVEQDIDAENRTIIAAFKKQYKFSDVYFFYSYQTQNVKDMRFENIFLNEDLEEDNSIVLDPLYTFYMIGDFDQVKTLTREGEYNGSSLISRALVMKDRDFEQMARPFPFFIRAGNKKQIDRQVFRLNQQLTWFYNAN